MIIQSTVRDFKQAWGLASSVVPSNSNNLSCIKVSIDGSGNIILGATDKERCVIAQVGGGSKGTPNSAIGIPEEIMSKILGRLSKGEIAISSNDGNYIVVSSGPDSEWRINAVDHSLFPALFGIMNPTSFKVDAGELSSAISRTKVPEAKAGSSIGSVAGIFFDWFSGKMTTASYDGAKLATQCIDAECLTESRQLSNRMVPMDSLNKIQSFLKDGGTIDVGFDAGPEDSGGSARFSSGNVIFSTCLLARSMIDFRKFQRPAIQHTFHFPADDFVDRIERACVFADSDKNASRRVDLSFSRNVVTFSSPSETGNSRITMAVEYSGEPFTISYSSRMLTETLSPLGGSEVTYEIPGPLVPSIFRSGGFESFISVMEK